MVKRQSDDPIEQKRSAKDAHSLPRKESSLWSDALGAENPASGILCPKLWANADKIDIKKGTLKAYLASIARNTAKNKFRDLKEATLPIQDKDIINFSDPYEHMEKQEMSERIVNALKSLKTHEMEIFIKYYYYYEHIEKISKDLKINKNTIKSILKRGRKKIERYLNKSEGGVVDEKKDNGLIG